MLLLLIGPWLLPLFVASGDANAPLVVSTALILLMPAAAYQLFDGLYFGSSFCLRAAGDTRVPAMTALVLSWGFFVPLAHTLIFDSSQAWIPGLPQAGLGALGGWLALMSYAMVLGVVMYRRWRSNRWQQIDLWRGDH
jgi:MATE family multidrug resistance protein